MKNKIISLVLALVMVFSVVSLSTVVAFAADTALTVTKVSETPTTVKVAVGITGNTGLGALGATLNYDNTILKLESVDGAGITSAAGMPVFEGAHSDGSVSITVMNSNSGAGTKENGTVCIATFTKLSTVADGTQANISVNSDEGMTLDIDGNAMSVGGGSAAITLSAAAKEEATKAPEVTKAPEATKKPEVTKKPDATKNPVVTTRPAPNAIVSPTLPGVTVPTTAEVTTEEYTYTYPFYEENTSYVYEEPTTAEAEEDESKPDVGKIIKFVVLIGVILLCVAAIVVVVIISKKKSN